MGAKYWDKLTNNEETPTPKSWWFKVCLVIGAFIGLGMVCAVAALFFIFLGWCFAGLWNYAITPIFNVTEITAYMGAALLAIIYGSIRLFKFAFKH